MSNTTGRKKKSITMMNCNECHVTFVKKKWNQLYCSTKCKFRNWALNNPRVKLGA